jgi:DNA-binding XRE family transcriptional regulator
MQSLNPAPTSSHSMERINSTVPTSSPSLHDSRDLTRRLPNSDNLAAPGHTSTSPARPAGFLLPIDVSSRFGARLRELRRERNLTQLKMATDFGIDRSFISDVERGRKSISLPMLEVIALGMKMSLSDLLQNI